MKQRTPGKEKMPGRGLETGLDPKENKATGCGEGPGHRETPCASISRDSRQWHPSLRHKFTDSDLVPPGLILRWVNSTPARVAPKQSWGLSGSCPAKTASEDLAHLFSLGFRRQSVKQSWGPYLADEEQHSEAGGRTLDSATLDPRHEKSVAPGTKAEEFPNITPWAPPHQPGLLRLFPLLSCQRATEQVPRPEYPLQPMNVHSTCWSRGQCFPYT